MGAAAAYRNSLSRFGNLQTLLLIEAINSPQPPSTQPAVFPMSDKPNADTTKKPAMAAEAAQQSSPIDTAAAQLVYDDLRRFCEARRSDIASIITRSQFLLVLTSSLYAAYFIARPSPMAFSLLEAIAVPVMLPSILMLLQAGRPLDYFDKTLDVDYMLRRPNTIPETTLILVEDQAAKLLALNKLRGRKLRRSYYTWLVSLFLVILLLIWSYS